MTIPQEQKPKDKVWKDHNGTEVPLKYVSKLHRLQERNAHRIAREACAVSNSLTWLKGLVRELHNEVVEEFGAKEGVNTKEWKGNKEWYCFDRSIRIVCKVQENIRFDDLLIKGAREKLNEFLRTKLSSDEEFLVELVTDAFSTTNGKLDPKKVLSLTAKRNKIRSHLYHEACDLIERSITRVFSKFYFHVSIRNAEGGYDTINLDFTNA